MVVRVVQIGYTVLQIVPGYFPRLILMRPAVGHLLMILSWVVVVVVGLSLPCRLILNHLSCPYHGKGT